MQKIGEETAVTTYIHTLTSTQSTYVCPEGWQSYAREGNWMTFNEYSSAENRRGNSSYHVHTYPHKSTKYVRLP